MREYAPIFKDAAKALGWATVCLFALTLFIVTAMWLYYLVFDRDHFDRFNAELTGRAIYADSATQRVQQLGEEKAKQIDKIKKQIK